MLRALSYPLERPLIWVNQERDVVRYTNISADLDGTALYEAVAPVFLAQLMGRQLGIGQLVIVR